MRIDRPLAIATATAIAFAAAGGIVRYELRMTESRLQIAAFGALAVAGELAAFGLGARPSWRRAAVNTIAAALTIVSMKFHLEPEKKAEDGAIVRHAARAVGRDLGRTPDR